MKTQSTPAPQLPASTDISCAYMEQLRLGNIKEAARIIMQANPMPMLTGRVCA
jgi:NADPH-dependent glutamate synthase beta subunit-like oxidoreductase